MKTPKKIVFCRGSIRDIQRLVKELTKLVDDIMKLEFNGKSIQKECTVRNFLKNFFKQKAFTVNVTKSAPSPKRILTLLLPPQL